MREARGVGKKERVSDDKLRAAITDVCAGELGKELNRAAEEEKVKFRRPLAGSQMVRLIHVYFQTKQSLNQVYGLTNFDEGHVAWRQEHGAVLQLMAEGDQQPQVPR